MYTGSGSTDPLNRVDFSALSDFQHKGQINRVATCSTRQGMTFSSFCTLVAPEADKGQIVPMQIRHKIANFAVA